MANTWTIADAPRSIESMTTHRPTSACFDAMGSFRDASEDAESEGRITHIVANVMYPPHEHHVRVLFFLSRAQSEGVELVELRSRKRDVPKGRLRVLAQTGGAGEENTSLRARELRPTSSHLEQRHDPLERVEVDLGRRVAAEDEDRRDPERVDRGVQHF